MNDHLHPVMAEALAGFVRRPIGLLATGEKALSYRPMPYSLQELDDAAELAEAGPTRMELVCEALRREFKAALAGMRVTLPTAIRFNAADDGETDRWAYDMVQRSVREVLADLLDSPQAREKQAMALLLNAPCIFTGYLSDTYLRENAEGLAQSSWSAS